MKKKKKHGCIVLWRNVIISFTKRNFAKSKCCTLSWNIYSRLTAEENRVYQHHNYGRREKRGRERETDRQTDRQTGMQVERGRQADRD